MAGKTFVDADNLLQLCSDMIAVKEALIEVGVDIPNGTPSSRYGELIKELFISMRENNIKNVESGSAGPEEIK